MPKSKPPRPSVTTKPWTYLHKLGSNDFKRKHLRKTKQEGLQAMSRLKNSGSVNSVILTRGSTNFNEALAAALFNNEKSFTFWCEKLLMASTTTIREGSGRVNVFLDDEWKICHLHASEVTLLRREETLSAVAGAQHITFEDSEEST